MLSKASCIIPIKHRKTRLHPFVQSQYRSVNDLVVFYEPHVKTRTNTWLIKYNWITRINIIDDPFMRKDAMRNWGTIQLLGRENPFKTYYRCIKELCHWSSETVYSHMSWSGLCFSTGVIFTYEVFVTCHCMLSLLYMPHCVIEYSIQGEELRWQERDNKTAKIGRLADFFFKVCSVVEVSKCVMMILLARVQRQILISLLFVRWRQSWFADIHEILLLWLQST